jgi:long-chain acyl-CoA synthetase
MPTFYDRFLECAEHWPQNTALEIQKRDRVETYTYAELRRMAEAVGRWLVDNRFQPDSRLAILADNHPRWVAAYLGIIAAGCTAVPLDTALHSGQIAKLLDDSGTALLFVDVKHLPLAREAIGQSPVAIVLTDPEKLKPESSQALMGDLDKIFTSGPADFKPVPSAPDRTAALLYTSGTTADPKGVMLTHANLLAEADAVFAVIRVGPADAVLGILPLFHALAQMANLLLPLVRGARVVYLETLNTTELLRGLRERNITVFAVVPQFFYLIHERIQKEVARRGRLAQWAMRALMSVNRATRALGCNAGKLFFRSIHEMFGDKMRYLFAGGSRWDPHIGRDFYSLGIDVLQAYGLTETSGGAFVTPSDDNVIGSVGKPLAGVEAKILQPEPQEHDAPPVGEIAIRGGIIMKGYWNRPEATAGVLKDGWLHTGDLGYFDSHGNLFITGRKKDIIVLSNGKNVYPEEIEAHYLRSPFIKEICVLGLEARPGDPTSEHLHAVIVPNFETLRERKIVNMKEVIRFDIEGLSTQLPSTKRIGSYEIWQQDLPRTTTRKLKRFEIEKRVRANQAAGRQDESQLPSERPVTAEEQVWAEQSQVRQALQVIREQVKTPLAFIRPPDNLELDLGLDSMQRVELLAALEEQFGGDVDESRLAEIYTVRDLVTAVLESAPAGSSGLQRAPFAGWKAILEEEPSDPDVLALAKPRPFGEAFFYFLSRLLQVFALDRFDLRVRGLEKLPKHGPYIISSNHQSFLDPIILGSVLPWPVFRHLVEEGTSEIFGSGFMRQLARWLRVIVVDPDANLIPAMRTGAFVLRHGRILILYPEGERSIDGTPKVFKKGAAILSIHLQVPIIPVAIEGFYDAWPRSRKFQGFVPLQIAFGDPIYPPPAADASEAGYEKLTQQLKSRVVEMWSQMRDGKLRAHARETAFD